MSASLILFIYTHCFFTSDVYLGVKVTQNVDHCYLCTSEVQQNLTFGVKVTQYVDQYSLHYVTFAPAKFEVATSKCLVDGLVDGSCILEKIQYLTFDIGVKVTQNNAQYPLHHLTNAAAKFEVAMSNSLGSNALAK